MWPCLIVRGSLCCQVVGQQKVNCKWLWFFCSKVKKNLIGFMWEVLVYVLEESRHTFWRECLEMTKYFIKLDDFWRRFLWGSNTRSPFVKRRSFHELLSWCLYASVILFVYRPPRLPSFHWSHVRLHILFFAQSVRECSSSYPVSVQEFDFSSPNVSCLSWKCSPVYKLAWVKPHIMPALASIRVFALAHRWVPRTALERQLLNF